MQCDLVSTFDMVKLLLFELLQAMFICQAIFHINLQTKIPFENGYLLLFQVLPADINVVYERHLISNNYDGHSAKVSTFVDLRVHSRDILERIGAEQIENQNVCVGITDSIC